MKRIAIVWCNNDCKITVGVIIITIIITYV